VHTFGFAQHDQFFESGGPRRQHVSLSFLQQRPGPFALPGSRQQNWVAWLQQVPLPPHLSQHLPFLHSCFEVQQVVPHFFVCSGQPGLHWPW
jgi:hypothetical protein